MSIQSTFKTSAAIGLALVLFYCGAVWGNGFKTQAQWTLGILMVLSLVLHSVLPRKWARRLFCVWAMISIFFILWLLGYTLAMWLESNCFTDAFGEERCVMPILQLLVGFVFAVVGEVFVVLKLRRFSQPKWECIWQICLLFGFAAGTFYDWAVWQWR
ncbi:hypothetical protein MIS45_10215 [Wielerella bovis]|uniref:hypothetical protein n=1 Tax=Wielerella bovis TaxID=2917790 RepID=UPI002019B2B8|nr:hypothetical protein [Wielerella bovis]ULJ69111.1 hypothetical protein MIS45_10215 [Wielerella bovis]